MIRTTLTALVNALRRGEAPTWLRESREALARRTLYAETARLEPTDEVRAYVVYLGVGAAQDYASAFLHHVEGGEPAPAVPPGLPARRAWEIRTMVEELSLHRRFPL